MCKVNKKLLSLLKDMHNQLNYTNNQAFYENEESNVMLADSIKKILDMFEGNTYNEEFKIDSNSLGSAYESFNNAEVRKSMGQFYTPDFIIEYIMERTVKEADVLANPYVKVLDPSCGSGYFLVSAYDVLREKFAENLADLRKKFKDDEFKLIKNGQVITLSGELYWQEENIHYHLLRHCIYGADIDSFALKLTAVNLLLKNPDSLVEELNLVNGDSLIRWEKDYDFKELENQMSGSLKLIYNVKYKDEYDASREKLLGHIEAQELIEKCKFFSNKFDYVIGNPPYIGHKDLTYEYKAFLKAYYKEIFKDKSDISYCFIYRFSSKDILKGKLSFITSRYFLESPTGSLLRKYIKNNLYIESILDFYGVRILENIGVDPVIFSFSSENEVDKIFDKGYSSIISVVKVDNSAAKMPADELFNLFKSDTPSKHYNKFSIPQSDLRDSGWILIPQALMNIVHKIENKCNYALGDICQSFQGIITGCDKAFIIKEDCDINIDKTLLKVWIKNSNVGKYMINKGNLKLIYSDLIEDEGKYESAIRHIHRYKEKLENRRECKKGIRKWYQLQWGREEKAFYGTKIVFPYKAESNRFAIDDEDCFFSADIYGMKIKDDKINYPALVGILNSKLYEVYFKCFAKKLGDKLYDYYPNTVMRLHIPVDTSMHSVEDCAVKILECIRHQNSRCLQYTSQNENMEKEIDTFRQKIDNILYNYFDLNIEEINIIEKVYKNK